ncbi:MAG: hypothetical protein IPK02_05480 [Candidatus Accumulibacter sp.]|uniref:Uncharacterized protein n=1 Tax=Candidatus Accumulibacter affinis TaxID=2954384 RepID=A0A935TBM7_9PROT|nr:hypothetical protein [Candidatus Accumulibacter affinis]
MRALSRWVGAFAGGLSLLFFTGGVAAEVPQARDFGVPGTNASHWPRWLPEDPGRSDRTTPATAASTPLTMAAGDSLRQRFSTDAVVQKWASGPASLPWIGLTLELIVKYQQNPLRAARVLAHLHAAANDAIVQMAATSSAEATQAVAVHAATSAVLAYFYPQELPGRLDAIGVGAMLAVAARARVSPEKLAFAREVGRRAAAEAIRRALDDGSDATWNPADRPAAAAPVWRAAPPLNLYNPSEPLAGNWRTWALEDSKEISPPQPVPFGSERYWNEAQEVLRVSRALTPEQKRIADEWNLDKGSVTPPGVWNRKAMELVAGRGWGTAETARVLAALNVALSDALIACWWAKFAHWTVRPVNVVREKLDPDFLPCLRRPSRVMFPGHAAASGAAVGVLAAFFRSAPPSCKSGPRRRRCRASTAGFIFAATTTKACGSAGRSDDE